MVPGKHIVSIHLDDSTSKDSAKAPTNSPTLDRTKANTENRTEGDLGSDQSCDLEIAAKKVESLYI